MLTIPFKISQRHYSIFVILEEDNLKRLKDYDPAEIVLSNFPEEWKSLQLKDIIIGYANEKDKTTVNAFFEQGEPEKALRYLSRGFKFKPEDGDHDNKYESIMPKAKNP